MYSAQIKQALESVERNQGVLWGFQPHEVPLLWAELETKGYIRLNRWSNRMELTPAGREALEAVPIAVSIRRRAGRDGEVDA